jgi:ABC-2 type transport system ATP-binding protein
VRDILTMHAAYHGVPRARRKARADQLLSELGLADRAREKIVRYSGGMGQRVMLARALMHEPEVLFLDEPTNNLDPQSRLFLWERIQSLHQQGVTIILTTHDMHEADRLCERIAIMDHGRILALDTPEKLKRMIPGGLVLEIHVRIPAPVTVSAGTEHDRTSSSDGRFISTLKNLPGISKVESISDGNTDEQVYRLYLAEETDDLTASVYQAISQEQGKLLNLHFMTPSLEDVFLYLTGKDLRR